MISYEPLWKTMKKKNVSQYKLLKSGIDTKTLDAIRKGHNITLLTLEKLCNIIGCTPNDIVKFVDEEKK
ncbi:MAG: helix-turn-helix transcriptional regulator [Erysipelotrichaceae bacterium]|nr:helix-turn-helix transcriptional regulator [Erysipelotrichaceae bacterium]